ncbi:peptidase M48-like protein [Fluviicoccus keumensis]|uniref:Peptidase M48-like protein n=1 Tax=Fluviicoccus keumensis TaxID=1435465 RepID=A0A4Q7Z5M8_9GAMM|nr:M48 family metallopeptidase [Fluviicoccus keumensis]RZU45151.1 peptidase M48-like protein [Fluviicoccus keumensis]
MNWRKWLAVPTLIILTACTSSTQQGATGITRKQLLLLPSAQVDAMALQSYRGELDDAKKKNSLNTDRATLERIRRIGDRLVPQTAVFRPDAVRWSWEVNLQTKAELNAYCAPGGKIMFFTGIIDQLKLTDDEIAAIMGHEIAHALREHGRERISEAYAQQAGMTLLAVLTNMDSRKAALLQTATTLGLTLPHSRGQESEADVMGVELMARAGYDPRASISLWKKMATASKGAPPAFLSTHPSGSQRIEELQARMATVLPLYEAARSNPPKVTPVIPRT